MTAGVAHCTASLHRMCWSTHQVEADVLGEMGVEVVPVISKPDGTALEYRAAQKSVKRENSWSTNCHETNGMKSV